MEYSYKAHIQYYKRNLFILIDAIICNYMNK